MDAHDATGHHAREKRGFRLGDGETPCRYATHPIMLSSTLSKRSTVGVYPALC